jgi:hypothetical protein
VEPVLPRHQDTGADRSCGRANLTAASFTLSPIAPRFSAHVQPPGDGGANSLSAAALAGRGKGPPGRQTPTIAASRRLDGHAKRFERLICSKPHRYHNRIVGSIKNGH